MHVTISYLTLVTRVTSLLDAEMIDGWHRIKQAGVEVIVLMSNRTHLTG